MLPFFSEVAAIRISFPRSWSEPWQQLVLTLGLGLWLQKELGPRHICLTEALVISILWAQVSLTGSRPQEKLLWSGKLHFFPTLIWSQRTKVSWVVCKGLHPTKGSW